MIVSMIFVVKLNILVNRDPNQPPKKTCLSVEKMERLNGRQCFKPSKIHIHLIFFIHSSVSVGLRAPWATRRGLASGGAPVVLEALQANHEGAAHEGRHVGGKTLLTASGDTFHFLVIFKKIVNQPPPPPEGLGGKTLEQVFGRGPAARLPSHTRNTAPRLSQPQCNEPHSLADPSIPQTPRVI